MKTLYYLITLTLSLSTFAIAQPSLTDVLLPQYIEGVQPSNLDRIPFAYRAKITGLKTSSTYRYTFGVVISTDGATTDGAGNDLFVKTDGSDFFRTSGPSLSTAGAYSEFTTDAAGSYTGWFALEPTGNAARFNPGKYIFMRIRLNDGAGGTTVVTRLTPADSVKVVRLGVTAADTAGTLLTGFTSAAAKDFVVLYDNIEGTGRPIAASYIESDGTLNTTANSYTAAYSSTIDGVSGAFGVVLPNLLPNGIRRIERRSLTTGNLIAVVTDADGIWPSGTSTVNPTGGVTPIVLLKTDVPLFSADITPPAAPQNLIVVDSSSKTVTIKWRKNTEADFFRYWIYRGTSPNPTTAVDTSAGISDTVKTFNSLLNGIRYYFRVTALDSSRNMSAYSNEVNASPLDRVAPASPVDLVITDSSNGKIGIRWRKNTESDFLRYRIYMGTVPNPSTKTDSATGGVNDTSKTFSSLVNGTRYYLRVTAVDSSGNESGYSNEVNGAPALTSIIEQFFVNIPKEYSLLQNYPNPFNPTTMIEYHISNQSFVILKIFDMLGREAATIVDEKKDAGIYRVQFNGSGLSSGLYFCRLDAGGFAQIRRMLLLK